jgi:3-dehydroquinate dehydratase-1
MIYVSIAESTPERCLRAMNGVEFAEIRIDKIAGVIPGDVRKIFSRPGRLIATCRQGRIGDRKKFDLLTAAVHAGAAYVDIELGWDRALASALMETARSVRCRILVSHHDFERTPSRPALEGIIRRGFAAGGDAVKIACRVRRPADNARLLGLLDGGRPLVVVGLGRAGRITRIVAPLLGGLFTFASRGPGKAVAPGQLDRTSLEKIMARLQNV